MDKDDGLVENIGHAALSSLGNAIAELVGLVVFVGFVQDAVLVEPLDSLGVSHAVKWAALQTCRHSRGSLLLVC